MSYVKLLNIKNQREHHKKQTFKDEYVAFLKEM